VVSMSNAVQLPCFRTLGTFEALNAARDATTRAVPGTNPLTSDGHHDPRQQSAFIVRADATDGLEAWHTYTPGQTTPYIIPGMRRRA
jgi:hypothetical protein